MKYTFKIDILALCLFFSWLTPLSASVCDFDSDWDVDGLDVRTFAAWYAVGDSNADMNNDGNVDNADVALCSSQFGLIETDPIVEISNLKDNSVVKTGFIFGTAADDEQVDAVEVQLDSGSFITADGTTNWTYKLPTGTETWQQGSVHTISVRALDNAGNYSAVVVLTVRKAMNKDINGDGYEDVAVGAPGSGSGPLGSVFIYLGGKDGVSVSADTTIIGEYEPPSYSFGDSLVLGDVNGDGYADLAVSDYAYSSSHGRVWIFHGSSSGMVDKDLSAGDVADSTLSGEAGNSTNFGSYMASGDVNGDGYADLAVGAPGYSGKIHLFHGSSSGIPTTHLDSGGTADTTIVAENGGDFGESVSFGDIDGDGYADLAIGADGYSSDQGRTYLFYGSSSGIADTDLRVQGATADTTLTGISPDFGLGYSTAFGYFNDDGYADLAVSAASFADLWRQGYVYIFHGSAAGIADTDLSTTGPADTVLKGLDETASLGWGSQFGCDISVGDVTGDRFDDIAVGARLYNGNQGLTYLFHSTSAGIPDKDLNLVPADVTMAGNPSDTSQFGTVVGLSDVNGDGAIDLAVGAPAYPSFAGRVYLFHNTGSGIPAADLGAGDVADTILTGEPYSMFGYMLAD